MKKTLLASLLGLAAGLPGAWEPEGNLWVDAFVGNPRLFRFETEAWPIEAGRALPDNSRLELDAGALVRLRLDQRVDFSLAGPARLTVYAFTAPEGSELESDRVVLKLDEGALLCDGRFQLNRPADVVLSLPDRSVPLPVGVRFFAVASGGKSSFFLPVTESAGAWPATLEGSAGQLRLAVPEKPAKYRSPLPPDLIAELERPVRVFVIARDYNQDLGLWPRPAILGPMLSERLAQVPGISVVEGSGNTHYAYQANNALKSGEDFFVRELALARGARWVVVGNCVAETVAASLAKGEPGGRRVRGQAEIRLLEAEGGDDGLVLVTEQATTLVARAGRPLELADREAMEGAAIKASDFLTFHLEDLLAGKTKAEVLLRLHFTKVDSEVFAQVKQALAAMDTVQRVYRRAYSKGELKLDITPRKSVEEFKAQWLAWHWKGFKFVPDEINPWDLRVQRGNR